MNISSRLSSSIFLVACLLANLTFIPNAVAWISNAKKSETKLNEDEDTYTFVGRCTNGQPYRIFSYQMEVDGYLQSFYDYEGPAGQGTVRTNAAPQKMVVRVCRGLADISNGSKYD